jgi:hypothetical protein
MSARGREPYRYSQKTSGKAPHDYTEAEERSIKDGDDDDA